jgi:signal transduction histidine kinase
MGADLLKSTPLRMTLVLVGVFLVALALAVFTANELVARELSARVDRSLTDTFAVISQSYGDGDIMDLTASVDSHARSTRGHDQVFRLTNASGAVLAGNLGPAVVPTGWSAEPATALGLDGPMTFRLFSGKVGADQLVVGASSQQTDAVVRLTTSAFIGSAAILTTLVLLAGIVVALRAQRRLDGIADTMRRIGSGELAARISLAGRKDDIAMLSGQVNAALDRLSALVEGMRQVSVDIAHDLKTPLGRLGITIESAIEMAHSGGDTAELLLQAQDEARQINATFEALLRIAQIEAGARRARFAPVQLEDVAEAIVEIYGEVAVERGQSLQLHAIASPIPPVNGDRELLTQLLANLVENAFRHGGEGASVTLELRSTPGQVLLIVSDTGPGVPADEREKVFRRLYRLDKSRSTDGSGLGLSLVKAVADLHGAKIVLADNAPGLAVELTFPAASTSRPTQP